MTQHPFVRQNTIPSGLSSFGAYDVMTKIKSIPKVYLVSYVAVLALGFLMFTKSGKKIKKQLGLPF